jgi:hypothetical protein
MILLWALQATVISSPAKDAEYKSIRENPACTVLPLPFSSAYTAVKSASDNAFHLTKIVVVE